MILREAYFDTNTPELRNWLKEQGLTPVAHPDCYRQGLTAPYPDWTGDMIMYNDGLRSEEDNDMEHCVICSSEEEFKENVLKIIKKGK